MKNQINSQVIYTYLIFILVIIITAFVYSTGLNGPLIFDDFINLEPLGNLETGLVSWHEALRSSPHGIDRPVSVLSFIANWLITGSDIWYLKLTNLIIHLTCGTLVFYFSILLLNKKGLFQDKQNKYLALFIMALWLLSPYQVSTVLYVIQRMAQLSALFMLAGLLLYIKGRIKIENENLVNGIVLIAISLLFCWPLSFFSKQNGPLFPLFAILIEVFFFNKNSVYTNKFKCFLAILISIPAIIGIVKLLNNPGWLTEGYNAREFSLYERLITQARILFDYASNLILLPGGSEMGLFHDDYVKSTGLFAPVTTLFSIIALTLILFLSLWYRNKPASPMAFGIVFFLSGHIVESSFLPLELYFEHRNYLPSIGIYFFIGTASGFLLADKKYVKLMSIIMLVISLWFGVLTYYRTIIWQSWDSLLYASEKSHPLSWRTHTRLASLSILKKDQPAAFNYLSKARNLGDGKGEYGINLNYLISHCFVNKVPEEHFYRQLERTILKADTYTFSVIRWFTYLVESGECNDINLLRVLNIISFSIDNLKTGNSHGKLWELNLYIGKLYFAVGDKEQALIHYLKAFELNNSFFDTAILALELLSARRDYVGVAKILKNIELSEAYKYRYQREIFDNYKKEIARY